MPRQCRGGFFGCCCKRAGSKPGAGAAALLRLCHAELASAVSRRAGLRLEQRRELAGELDSEPPACLRPLPPLVARSTNHTVHLGLEDVTHIHSMLCQVYFAVL